MKQFLTKIVETKQMKYQTKGVAFILNSIKMDVYIAIFKMHH